MSADIDKAVTRLLSAMAPTLQTFKERLALLYVLNDVLYHATNTFRQSKSFIPSATVQYLTPLLNSVKSASSARSEPIDKLLRLWSEEKYFTDEEYAQVTGLPPKTGVSTGKVEVEQKQLVKPAMLGVPGDPHWLLPVSCMLDVVVLSIFKEANNRSTLPIIHLSRPQVSKP